MRAASQFRKQIRIEYRDDDVQQRVSRFLNSRHFSTFLGLDVQVVHGEVTLTGEVDSYYEKQVAMTSCQHVAGVLGLIDRIEVRQAVAAKPIIKSAVVDSAADAVRQGPRIVPR